MTDGFSISVILTTDPDWPVAAFGVGVFSDIGTPAATADDQASEEFLAIVVVGIFVRHNLSLTGATAGNFLLQFLKHLPVNDCLVAVPDIDFAEFPRVFPLLFGAEILTEGFLQESLCSLRGKHCSRRI